MVNDNDTARSLVKSLIKGMAVLEALSYAGESTAAQIAQRVKQPRPTVHRLLETLCETGYVLRDPVASTYCVSTRIQSLAKGCRYDDWIAEISTPILLELYEKVVWPSDVATYDEGRMVIRATTHGLSPLSIQRVPYGHRVPLFVSATGLTYLAYTPPRARDSIIEVAARQVYGDEWNATKNAELLKKLKIIRQQGYGIRIRGDKPKTSTIAVPIISNGRAVACINIHWIDSAVDVATIRERYLDLLFDAAYRITQAYKMHVPGKNQSEDDVSPDSASSVLIPRDPTQW